MAHTNAWDESTPLGTENASTADNYFRNHRLDLGERLEEMIYGFNASNNSGAENEVGIKYFKFYKQTSDPTQVTDYGHFYVKLVDGVPELFFQDDTNTTLQLTSGGNLKSSAGLIVDGNGTITGTSTLTGNVACAGTLDVAGNIDPTSYETTNGGFLDEDDMDSDSATAVASQQSIKAFGTMVPAVTGAGTGYEGEESITLANGAILKSGYVADTGGAASVTFDAAFPTGVVCAGITCKATSARTTSAVISALTTSAITIQGPTAATGYYWWAIGY